MPSTLSCKVEDADEIREQVKPRNASLNMCGQHPGLSARAAAEVGDAGLSGQIVNEAEGLEGGLRAAGALPFQAGKIIADEVKIEFVNCFIFVTH